LNGKNMKALISPIEPVENGYRVAEVSEKTFEVAPPFFWVDCGKEVVADMYWYDQADKSIKPKLEQEQEAQPEIFETQTVIGAQSL
jgi:hypothetical protein